MARPESGHRILSVTAVAAACLYASPAAAYILPADAILADMAERRAQLGFTTLIAEGYRGTAEDPNQHAVWWALKPGKGQRLEITNDAGKLVIVTAGRKRWTFREGEAPGKPQRVRADLMIDFLADTSGDKGSKRGLAFLDALKISDEQVHLGRLGDHIAYVIGGRAKETDKPQLWVDKNLLTPIRLITIDPSTKARSETRMVGFGSPLTGEWFPRRVEVWRDGAMIERTTIVRVRVNEPLADALFDVKSRR